MDAKGLLGDRMSVPATGRTGIFVAALAMATPAEAETLSFYGTPGLIDMPNAYVLNDGEIALTTAGFGDSLRNTFAFQITPRLQGVFRYSYIRGFNFGGRDLFDRSFDLSYQIARETATRPALAVGLRDFGGTGIYSSEYLVATKAVTPEIRVTGGLGWGRLAGRNSFSSPLAEISDRFATRPDVGAGGIQTTGQIDFGAWFRGDIAPFAGVSWAATDKLTFVAEYSSDIYAKEESRGLGRVASPLNFGVQYKFDNGVTVGGYSLYGRDVGVSLSYVLNPAKAPFPGGRGQAPRALSPRSEVVAASTGSLQRGLSAQGMTLENLEIRGDTARIHVVSSRFPATAQALGRAARVLANRVDPSVEIFEITFVSFGMPVSTVTLRRADLEELEFDVDSSWRTLARAQIEDAAPVDPGTRISGVYPGSDLSWGTFFTPSLFDPDNPFRFETGLKLTGFYAPRPGLILSGEARLPLYSTIDESTRVSNSILPKVRSDAVRYFESERARLTHLTAEMFTRPKKDVFGRVTVGYLEQMYGGISAEVLWYPVDSRLAVGAEVNYARQRDFDGGFGFQDYDVWTGHASAYYDFGNGFYGQLDAGRYLAGDWGATVTLDREFNNGVKVGAFFTLTDVPFEDFGEGSFDKGIRISFPVGWLTGQPSQRSVGQVIRPVLRDGGARLAVRNRLYDTTRGLRGAELADSWGLFWR